MKTAVLSCFLCLVSGMAGAQELEGIGKQKPFVLHGSIGASTTYFTSNEIVASRPPWSWNLYGNLNPTIYGISMPVSFVINQYGKSYTQPFGQFGISPTYKWARLHLGYRTIQMSPMVFEGQSFRGVGVELNPKLLRFAAFYGKLNRRVNEDTTSGQFSQPQFSRLGYGVKLGVGNQKHYIDLLYFHAKDDSTSAEVISKDRYLSLENSVIGLSFKTTLLQDKITWTGDLATSANTEDLASPELDSIPNGIAEKIFSKLMPFRTSTRITYSGQTAVSVALKNYTGTLGYRRIAPGYKSLGTPYMINDIELVNWMNNLNLSQGKLNINTSISNQHNNLKKDLASQMNTFVGNLNVNAILTDKFNLNFNYSGYLLNQDDGTIKLTDSVRLAQQIHQFSLAPSYTIYNTLYSHTISTNINYMLLNDDNVVTSPFTSSNNLSTSLNYTLGLVSKGMNFSVTGLYNQFKQDTNRYTSYGANLGTSAQFLKQKNLGVQATVGYILNESSLGDAQSNITFSGSVNYRFKKHSLNAYGNYVYTPYNPINDVVARALRQVVASKNFFGGISYNYSF
ncbi:MAG: hypothetical protein EOO05_10355 [Chitinophagaceae bacterium]|nr:MAG: hypothetical protein EOO05_10355 [Chitinophagaceae bacterium]